MASVRSLGYLRLVTTRPAEWTAFATDILGMMPVPSEQPGTEHFRIDEYAHRLAVTAGPASRLEAMGYEVANGDELAELAAGLTAEGLVVTAGSEQECSARSVSGMLRFTDPGGLPVELFHGPRYDYSPVVTPLVSGFVSGSDVGLGHTAMACPGSEKAVALYTGLLGFAERNTMRRNDRRTYFLSPNARQHTLALSEADEPRMSHFMLEMRSIDDVGRALDRVTERGTPLLLGLGRHTNDKMLSFYVTSPDGFSVEVGFGGLMVEGSPPTFEIPSPTLWGHRRTAAPA